MTINNLISSCAEKDAKAQRILYNQYGKSLIGIAIRYVPDISSAQDVLQESFIRIFKNISKVRLDNEKSLVAWMRKITVNESLRWLSKNKKHFHESLEKVYDLKTDNNDHLETNDMLKLVNALPFGFRIVFNLYVIEGYSHKEIAQELKIKESTSRSQLVRARKMLQNKITKMDYYAKVR